MNLVFWKPGIGINFGETLNTIMWKKIFPEYFFTTKPYIALSVLNSAIFGQFLRKEYTNVIFGSGSGYVSENPQDIINAKNNIWMFVRGPLTSDITGCKYITDAGVLSKTCMDLKLEEPKYITFINHLSMKVDMNEISKTLREENELYNSIEVGEPVEDVIKTLKNTKLLLSSSLHAAVIADAMGVPWIPINYQPSYGKPAPGMGMCYFKWKDWAYSLNVSDMQFSKPSNYVLRSITNKKEFLEDFKKLSVQRGYLSDRILLSSKIYQMLEEVEKFKKWFNDQPDNKPKNS